MRVLGLLLIASTLSACATAPQPMARSERAQARLQEELAGLAAGQPQSCIPSWRADQMTVIDDNTILFRSGSTLYFEVALVLALLGFVTTVALAKFLMRGEVIE